LALCLVLAAGFSRPAPAGSLPQFDEVYQLLRTNLQGATSEELDSAAVRGLVAQLAPRVFLVEPPTNGAQLSPAAPLAATRVFDKGFAYCRIAGVTSNLPEAFRSAFREVCETNKDKIRGVVIDLRFADGFDYAAAAKMADSFLNSDRPLLDWQSGSARATPKAGAITLPVAVLVNSQTTGAAEGLAAVLRDAGVGLILGGSTAGQASIFKEFPLRDGGKLRVAVAPVRFGAGKTLSRGLAPDIAVEESASDERAYLKDPYKVLHPPEGAKKEAGTNQIADQPRLNEVELIREHRNGEDTGEDDSSRPAAVADSAPPLAVVADPVLARALDLLKGLAVVEPNRPE
jgi:hypothetical protein